jgi:hypothetical protein
MPDYASSIVALIDTRVDQARQRVTHFGTVTDRATGSLDSDGAAGAQVVLDGSAGTAVPVKCFANVIVARGDRVGLVKYGGDWVVMGTYSGRTLADEMERVQFVGGGASPGASYVDIPQAPTVALTKLRDDTLLRVHIEMSARSSATGTAIDLAARVAGGVAGYDLFIRRMALNAGAGVQTYLGGKMETVAHPAGDYTLTPRWLRQVGAGTITLDGYDSLSIEVREVWP